MSLRSGTAEKKMKEVSSSSGSMAKKEDKKTVPDDRLYGVKQARIDAGIKMADF